VSETKILHAHESELGQFVDDAVGEIEQLKPVGRIEKETKWPVVAL
jgi:hypothetical protein